MLRPTQGTLRIWAEPFTKLRVSKLFNLRSDPYERADVTSNTYYDWFMSDEAGVFIAAPSWWASSLRRSRSIRQVSGHRASASISSSRRCRRSLRHLIRVMRRNT
jgi:hypothetical protein